MRILKFGGTSVGSPESIRQIKTILATRKKQKMLVVVSAFNKVTDQLIDLGKKAERGDDSYRKDVFVLKKRHLDAVKELLSSRRRSKVAQQTTVVLKELEEILHGVFLIRELSAQSLDLIMSFGERLSAFIISHFLSEQGIPSEFLDARSLIKTDEHFGSARVDFKVSDDNIRHYLKKHKALQVATGFIGSTASGATTTLGRGGSDYSAAIFGGALQAEEVEIWTDVDGVMTTDPRKVKDAFSLKSISYLEAMEMSHFGAKVIHPPTMRPAMLKKIPLRIKNTFHPEFPGTVIGPKSEKFAYPIKGISLLSDVTLLTLQGPGMQGVPGTSMRLFASLARQGVNVILISQASSEHSICFAVSPSDAEKAKKAIDQEFAFEIRDGQIDRAQAEGDLSIVAIVGEQMKSTPGISAKLFSALGRSRVNVVAIAQGSSELNISVVIAKVDQVRALQSIHDTFFSNKKIIHLYLVGAGNIGGTLLKQLESQAQGLKEKSNLEIKIMGVADKKTNMKNFLAEMKKSALPNSVFVDCTASEKIAELYAEILVSGISVVTPNKKAASGDYKAYKKLKQLARDNNVQYRFETNVGAGLPVINTLNDLMMSGDRVEKIEAVLSGTLSYIFNTFDGSVPFSEVVRQAKDLGYTEPEPRDDLSGLDVARKILILARESGAKMELKDVVIIGLLDQACMKAKTVEEFFVQLKNMDQYFATLAKQAKKNKGALRFIASFEHGKATLALREVSADHPFASLSGADNIIAFTTQRYHTRPLVIKGPGAGVEVTAAGVFADILECVL